MHFFCGFDDIEDGVVDLSLSWAITDEAYRCIWEVGMRLVQAAKLGDRGSNKDGAGVALRAYCMCLAGNAARMDRVEPACDSQHLVIAFPVKVHWVAADLANNGLQGAVRTLCRRLWVQQCVAYACRVNEMSVRACRDLGLRAFNYDFTAYGACEDLRLILDCGGGRWKPEACWRGEGSPCSFA